MKKQPADNQDNIPKSHKASYNTVDGQALSAVFFVGLKERSI